MVQFFLVGGLEHGLTIFPNSWDDDPIWRTHIFQGGWNHQPDLKVQVTYVSVRLEYLTITTGNLT